VARGITGDVQVDLVALEGRPMWQDGPRTLVAFLHRQHVHLRQPQQPLYVQQLDGPARLHNTITICIRSFIIPHQPWIDWMHICYISVKFCEISNNSIIVDLLGRDLYVGNPLHNGSCECSGGTRHGLTDGGPTHSHQWHFQARFTLTDKLLV